VPDLTWWPCNIPCWQLRLQQATTGASDCIFSIYGMLYIYKEVCLNFWTLFRGLVPTEIHSSPLGSWLLLKKRSNSTDSMLVIIYVHICIEWNINICRKESINQPKKGGMGVEGQAGTGGWDGTVWG